jgi:NAD(P)-dependent dehydrogenase (short-subunit alcohol dehydrogenase family)
VIAAVTIRLEEVMSEKRPGRVVVAGGTGGVGVGIVGAFAHRGYDVLVPSRSEEKIAALLSALPPDARARVQGEVVDAEHVSTLERYRDALVSTGGPVDAVVATLGGWWQGTPLHEIPQERWSGLLDQGVGAHFRFARAFVPHLLDHPSSYTFVNGFSATTPYAQASAMSVSSAAQLMMARVMAEELSESPVRVNALVLGPIMTRARSHGRAEWLAAEDVGEFAAHLASSDIRGAVVSLMDRRELASASERLFGSPTPGSHAPA